MRDVDADKRGLAGETQALHSQKPKLEQVSHNLPGHKNADEELDKVWHEWKSIFDAIKDSIILIDGEFKIIQANLASSQLFGRPLDQIIGKTCWQLVHGTNEAPEECPLKRAKTTKKHEQIELYLPEKDIWIEASVSPVFDQQGNLSSAIHIIRDITDRKQMEELLRKERDKAQKYLDVAGVMFVAIDAEQRVGLINKKGCEILGYSEEEVVAKNWFDNFLPEKVREQVKAVYEKIVQGEIDSLEYYENPILTKTGQERLIAWHNTILRDDKGRFIATLSSGEDITDRKKTEEALREAEVRYRTIADFTYDWEDWENPDGRFRYVSASCERITGYAAKRFMDDPGLLSQLILLEDREIWTRHQHDAAKTPGLHEVQFRIQRPDGGIRWVEHACQPVTDQQGTFLGYRGSNRDITERKRAEGELRKFKTISDKAGYGVSIVDLAGNVIYNNAAYDKMHGYAPGELIGKHLSIFHPEWEMVKVNKGIEQLNRESSYVSWEVWHKRNDNTEFPTLMTGTLIKDENGKPLFMAGTAVDITERKRAEEALRESEERFSTVFCASPIGIVITRIDDGQIIDANPAFLEMFGKTRDEIIGHTSLELNLWIHPEERDGFIKVLREQGRIQNLEMKYRRKSGELGDLFVSVELISLAREPRMLSLMYDITKRKKAEQKLLDYQAQLKSLASQLTLVEERERRRLATKLHDRISQALVVSKIKLDALRKSGRSRKLNKALEDVCNSIDQTIQDTKTLTFDLGSPVLHELGFETAVSEWLTDQIQKKLGITVDFEDDGKPKPLDDDVRILLFRDVRELLTNVAKHASAHKVKVSIRKVGSEIHISVEDDGWGFDTKKVAATAVKEGGFGLFSIRERLGQLGGHLEIESEPGCGTKATLIAPLKQKKVSRKGKK
jgi:PAS domain S-box-containing protein